MHPAGSRISRRRWESRKEIGNQLDARRFYKARQLAEAAVAKWCKYGRPDTDCISAMVDLSIVSHCTQDHREYMSVVKRAGELTLAALGSNHPDYARAQLCLAGAYLKLEDCKWADRHLRRAERTVALLDLKGTLLHAHVLLRRSAIDVKLGRPASGEKAAVEALVIHRRHRQCLWAHGLGVLADAYRANGKHTLAASVARKKQQEEEFLEEVHCGGP